MDNGFGERLRQVRLDLGLTQKEAGDIIGMSPFHLSFIETGHRLPRLYNLIRICEAYDISSDWLLWGEADDG